MRHIDFQIMSFREEAGNGLNRSSENEVVESVEGEEDY